MEALQRSLHQYTAQTFIGIIIPRTETEHFIHSDAPDASVIEFKRWIINTSPQMTDLLMQKMTKCYKLLYAIGI